MLKFMVFKAPSVGYLHGELFLVFEGGFLESGFEVDQDDSDVNKSLKASLKVLLPIT